jgi:hypothetical protein
MDDKNISLFFFSTNYNKYIPHEILKNLYKFNNFNNKIIYKNENNIFKCNIIINEISNFYNIKKNILINNDSIITFIDLEYYNSYNLLVNMIEIIQSNFSYEKQIFFIGLYENEKQIVEILSENNLNKLFDTYNINIEYVQINLNFTTKLKIFFDGIIEDILQKQEYYENYYKKDEMNEINSHSHIIKITSESSCIFF